MASKPSKKSKRPDNRPARQRYWSSRRLRDKKVRNLVRYCGMGEHEALELWTRTRKGRMRNA